MNLNDFIENRREELGMSLQDLMDASGISWSVIKNIRSGGGIKESTKQKLALALKCSQGEINAAIAQQDQETLTVKVVKDGGPVPKEGPLEVKKDPPEEKVEPAAAAPVVKTDYRRKNSYKPVNTIKPEEYPLCKIQLNATYTFTGKKVDREYEIEVKIRADLPARQAAEIFRTASETILNDMGGSP